MTTYYIILNSGHKHKITYNGDLDKFCNYLLNTPAITLGKGCVIFTKNIARCGIYDPKEYDLI